MALRIVPYEPCHQASAREFDERLRAAGKLPFPIGDAPPPRPAAPPAHGIEFHHFVALDGDGAVRGGYFVRNQPFLVGGVPHNVGHYSAPITEGVLDNKFAAVGPMMLSHALKWQPLLFAMGMGGRDRPLPRMLVSMGWTMMETPFYFRILNARGFLRGAGPLRTSKLRRIGAEILAATGLGNLGVSLIQGMRTRGSFDKQFAVETVREAGDWADDLWQSAAPMFSFAGVRNARTLPVLYPSFYKPNSAFRLIDNGKNVAWAQLLDCQPLNTSYFGSMKVTALVDGLATEAALPSLIAAAVAMAKEQGADLIFSNQMHSAWTRALHRSGFFQGPSNYLLALSKPLAALLAPIDRATPLIHFNRGDGDGRVNLTS